MNTPQPPSVPDRKRQALELRPASPEDFEAILTLLTSAGLPTHDLEARRLEGFTLAKVGGRLVGVAGIEIHGRTGLLRSVAVVEEARNSSLGTALVFDRIAWARSQGLRALGLLTVNAEHWFLRFGFRLVPRAEFPQELQESAEFQTLCAESAKALVLVLDEARAVRETIQRKYGEAALKAVGGKRSACGCSCGDTNPVTRDLYDASESRGLPTEALLASLGCGNPTALAELKPGEVVLDLGSGGGIDVLLSARRVGPLGKAYGLDVTEEMLALARQNQVRAGAENVEFLLGEIESIPLPDSTVDVVISNCVINLSVDKPAVLAEIGRVLKPGGRIGISDVVAEDRLSPEERAERGSFVGCIAGALSRNEYEAGLEAAGFEQISVEFTHQVADGMHGAIVKAVKASDPETKGLPVVQPAAKAGCC